MVMAVGTLEKLCTPLFQVFTLESLHRKKEPFECKHAQLGTQLHREKCGGTVEVEWSLALVTSYRLLTSMRTVSLSLFPLSTRRVVVHFG